MTDKHSKDPFGPIMKSMNNFFQERPVKGFLQSIDEFFSTPFPYTNNFPIEFEEEADLYIVKARLAGIKKDQITLEYFPRYMTITIESEMSKEEINETKGLTKREVFMKKTTKSVPFPTTVNEKQIKATYEDGLLVIKIPKSKGKKIVIE